MQFDKMTQSPTYSVLIANRNKAWANALAQRLKQPGISFVAVGAAHMLGPDGVPALLKNMGFTVTRVAIAQTSPMPAAPSPTTVPSPTPSASSTPLPRTLTPPPGWKPEKLTISAGGMTTDMMWVDPVRGGAVVAGHLDLPQTIPDLDTLDAFFHQGLIAAAGSANVQPSKRVKICSGKQDGVYSKVTVKNIKEDIVVGLSDRAYIAEYVRGRDAKDNPAAVRSLLTLCTP